MHIYDGNIEALKKYMPGFYGQIEEKLGEYVHDTDDQEVLFLKSRNDSVYMQVTKDGNTVRLNSAYNPEREAVQWASQYEYKDYQSTVVMFGFGTGHFCRALIDRLGDRDNIIVYEPIEEVFFKILYEVDVTDIISSKRINFAIGDARDSGLFQTVAVYIPWMNVEATKVVVHPGYDKVFSKEYKLYVNVMNEVIESIKVGGNTEVFFGKNIAFNTARNIKYSLHSYYLGDFVGVFDEETVGIVVAAGPSLDKNIHLLHEVKDKAIIMATDTSLKRLHQEGIVPDFVVSVDPKKPKRLFEDVGFEDIPFMCRIDSNSEVMDMHRGPKIWINPSEFQCNLYNLLGIKIDVENSGGSVATMSFALCNILGLKNIVLIGQDLAYAESGNATHAGGEISRILNEDNNITYVKGNNGKMVKTRGDWTIYLNWYKRVIRMLAEDIRVINATEGGACIDGAEVMTLREVIDTLCDKDKNITDTINGVLENDHSEYNQMIYDYYSGCENDLRIIDKDFEKGITLCNRFEKKYSKVRSLTADVVKCMKDIKKISKRVGNKPVYMIIDEMIKYEDKDSIKEIYGSKDDEYESNIAMIRNTRHIFEMSRKAIQELKEEFSASVQELKRQLQNS